MKNKFTENQVKWLTLLETSEKTTGELTDKNDHYCCLGVACVATGKEWVREEFRTNGWTRRQEGYKFSGSVGNTYYNDYEESGLLSAVGHFQENTHCKQPLPMSASIISTLADLNDSTEITHRGIRKLMIDHPWLMLSNFDTPEEKPEIKLDEYIKYDEIEPIPQDMLQ